MSQAGRAKHRPALDQARRETLRLDPNYCPICGRIVDDRYLHLIDRHGYREATK